MLVDFSQMKNCYLVCGYTDLRKGIDGLASVITSQFQVRCFLILREKNGSI
ncbi:IS66 family insertion sequence element accessory protein TnpB [Oceanobacillus oncorhynchi]|uniref:IS66 family insertion sequence element accessory protein TnpB n=1 Tax=Oceanobacillus oncorhynchi TaxID=545501 RepID=UPI0034D527D6